MGLLSGGGRSCSVAAQLREQGLPVTSGQFQAHMDVALVNDGPVTLVIDRGGGTGEEDAQR